MRLICFRMRMAIIALGLMLLSACTHAVIESGRGIKSECFQYDRVGNCQMGWSAPSTWEATPGDTCMQYDANGVCVTPIARSPQFPDPPAPWPS
jgi:hypothetical protein